MVEETCLFIPLAARRIAMQADADGEDKPAIRELVARQFASLNWSPETSADWGAFAAAFHPEATLYPAARTPKAQTVDAFVERMKGLAETKLRSFQEAVLGTQDHFFGILRRSPAVRSSKTLHM